MSARTQGLNVGRSVIQQMGKTTALVVYSMTTGEVVQAGALTAESKL